MAHKCGGLRPSVYQTCGDPSIFSTNGSRREHGQYVLLAKPLQSSSFSENKKYMTQSTDKLSASHSEEHMLGHGFYNKHSHEQAKANTYMSVLILRP